GRTVFTIPPPSVSTATRRKRDRNSPGSVSAQRRTQFDGRPPLFDPASGSILLGQLATVIDLEQGQEVVVEHGAKAIQCRPIQVAGDLLGYHPGVTRRDCGSLFHAFSQTEEEVADVTIRRRRRGWGIADEF